MALTAAIAISLVVFLQLSQNAVHAFEIPSRNESGFGASDGPIEVAPGELVLAIVIMRHGDRAPQRHAPSYAAGDRSSLVGGRLPIDYHPWEVDYGQLTRLGMEQTREFGRRMRARYIVSKKGNSRGFLSRDYKHAETHVRSSDVDRTLVSGMNAMLGLYEDTDSTDAAAADNTTKLLTGLEMNTEMPLHSKRGPQHVIVPVHTVEYKRDALLDASAKAHCPRFFAAAEQMLSTEFCKGAIMRNTELLNALPALSGRAASSLSFPQLVDTLAALRDVRVAQRAHAIFQPKNVTRFDAALDDIVARVAIAKWDVAGLGSLVGGRLLKAVAKRIESMRGLLAGDESVREMSREECNAKGSDSDEDGACPRKLVLYVGHDTTIFDVRSGLGLNAVVGGADGSGVAPYASHVIFELRRKKVKKHKSRKTSRLLSILHPMLGFTMESSAEEYEYKVQVLTGSIEQKTKSVAGPFCNGKSSCSAESFLEFVARQMPADVDKACALDDGTVPTESSTSSGSSPRQRAPRSSAGVSVASIGHVLFATLFGAIAGYIVGRTIHRGGYDPIPGG